VLSDGGVNADAPYDSDSAVCRSYPDVSREIQGKIVARDLPTVTGGPLLEGTYALVAVQLFTGPSDDGGIQPEIPARALERGTVVIHDHALTFIGAAGTIESTLGPASQDTYLVEVNEASHELILTGVCGTSAPRRVPYSVNMGPVGVPELELFVEWDDGGLSSLVRTYGRR
jgi:hypothetical protein